MENNSRKRWWNVTVSNLCQYRLLYLRGHWVCVMASFIDTQSPYGIVQIITNLKSFQYSSHGNETPLKMKIW